MTCSFIGNLFSIRVIFSTDFFCFFFWHSRKGKVVAFEWNCVIELNDGRDKGDLLHAKTTFPPQTCPCWYYFLFSVSLHFIDLLRNQLGDQCCVDYVWSDYVHLLPALALMEYKLIDTSFFNFGLPHKKSIGNSNEPLDTPFFIAICCVSITFHHKNTRQQRGRLMNIQKLLLVFRRSFGRGKISEK